MFFLSIIDHDLTGCLHFDNLLSLKIVSLHRD